MNHFQRRWDGEYALCPSCARLGYGIDAWHPCTSEFWPVTRGLLIYSRCKACMCDRNAHKLGVISEAA